MLGQALEAVKAIDRGFGTEASHKIGGYGLVHAKFKDGPRSSLGQCIFKVGEPILTEQSMWHLLLDEVGGLLHGSALEFCTQ